MVSVAQRAGVASFVLALAFGSTAPAEAAEVRERVLGDENASVEIIEYASLTCPHCANFHNNIKPEIRERYIETGTAKLVYRDFPLDQLALQASVIAHCAGEDRYFPFLEVLYENQQRWARAENPTAALIQLAQLGGLGRDEAEACLSDEAMADAVLEMRLEGQEQHGVNSTPTFVINGEVHAGVSGVEDFAELIENAAD